MIHMRSLSFTLLLFLLVLTGCLQSSPPGVALVDEVHLATRTPVAQASSPATTALPPTATLPAVPPTNPPSLSHPTPALSPTPFFSGTPTAACGQLLPLVPAAGAPVDTLSPQPVAVAAVRERMPQAAEPALEYLLDNPENVGLVAYELGQETAGVSLNADVPMPLASVAKIIYMVAYVEAVATGELNPNTRVLLAELEPYYLPRFDLGAHPRAIRELEENGRVANDSVALDDVVWMMMRHSSNAATDYMHYLLGQTRIEETAISLGLMTQTAPCPFMAQFLAMGNHTQMMGGTLQSYLDDPRLYAQEAKLLADAYITDADFREAEIEARQEGLRPSFQIQTAFSHALTPHASAGDYAHLMARIAQNGLKTPDSSFHARRLIEWPMLFDVNQTYFYNLGYKNGSLPGILTTTYYAYRRDTSTPVVVVLFYRNLPNNTYRDWRNSLAHDEFARWLLIDPEAIPTLRELLRSS